MLKIYSPALAGIVLAVCSMSVFADVHKFTPKKGVSCTATHTTEHIYTARHCIAEFQMNPTIHDIVEISHLFPLSDDDGEPECKRLPTALDMVVIAGYPARFTNYEDNKPVPVYRQSIGFLTGFKKHSARFRGVAMTGQSGGAAYIVDMENEKVCIFGVISLAGITNTGRDFFEIALLPQLVPLIDLIGTE